MSIVAILLAAGKGTRFGECKTNKTAVQVAGKSLIQHGIDNIERLVTQTFIVVGHKKETVMNSVKSKKTIFVTQRQRLGTGHAVKVAVRSINQTKLAPEHVLVANGDHLFMINPGVLRQFLAAHKDSGNDVTILSTVRPHPENSDNGRIIRKNGQVVSIVEKANFTKKIRSINELNSGTYLFCYSALQKALKHAKRTIGKELYITDVLFGAGKVGAFSVSHTHVGTGVNTKKDLEDYLLTTKAQPARITRFY